MTVTVEIPMALPSVANGSHGHWSTRAKRVRAQRASTRWCLGADWRMRVLTEDFRPLAVTLTRVSPRKLDDDNLAYAFKAVRDEVAAYFGVDDADPRLTWRYAQAKGPPCVRISFEVTT